MKQRWILMALAASAMATAASAQAPAPAPAGPAVAPVTVQGALPPKTVRKQAQTFAEVRAGATARLGLIGRWREPLCVQPVNFAPEQAAQIKGRIERIAVDVGLPVAGAGCRSNVQIVLTSQPQAFIDNVAKADPRSLGFHYPSERNKVKTVTQPIQGWYKTATQTAQVGNDGVAFAYETPKFAATPGRQFENPDDPQKFVSNPGNAVGETRGAEIVDLPENGTPPGCAGSLLKNCERTVFKNVLIVVDSTAVAGKDIGALADYLAMMSLSHSKSQDACLAMPSIFDLMAKTPCPDRDTPTEVSYADAAFLTALYAANPETAAASMQVDIAARMSEMLIKTQAQQQVAVRKQDAK